MISEAPQAHVGRITEALDYIEANLAEDLSVEALAKRSGLSPCYFHRTFRSLVGEPPKQHVRRLRLERAAAWLKLSPRPVVNIAFGAGYATHEAFTRAFKSQFGVAPHRFRSAAAGHRTAGPMSDQFEAQQVPLRIATFPARRIAFVRHVGPYDRAADAFAQLAAWAAPRGLLRGTMLFRYLDDQEITAPERTRCDAALIVGDGIEGDREVGVRCLPRGDCAVFRHRGTPDERRRLYSLAYRESIPALGRTPSSASPFEVHAVRGRGVDYGVTDVHVPLRSR